MEGLIERIARAKAIIDRGFSRVGPSLRADHAAEEALVGAASRAISLADAIVLLCKHNHVHESAFLLRALAGTAMAMRWLAGGSSDIKDESELWRDMWDLDWRRVWSEQQWRRRMKSAGVSQRELKILGEAISAHEYSNMYPGPFSVPWAHVFHKHRHSGLAPEAVLKTALQAMAHVVKALDVRWPNSFPGAEELCSLS